MGNRNDLTRFRGVKKVRPAPDLDEKGVRRLMRHIGYGDHVPTEEFKGTPLEVQALCLEQGIQVTGTRNGATVPIWVSPRKLHPVHGDMQATT